MTTEQIEMTRVIAEYDGWKYHDKSDVYRPNGYWTLAEIWAGWWVLEDMAYLTEMNWLHPVAMKVMGELEIIINIGKDADSFVDANSIRRNMIIMCYRKPINGQYIDLFTAVYNGIVFLNEQNVNVSCQ